MNREPVNPDDPQMSAYALGELNAAESAEFEARLQDSPNALKELEEMEEVMKLLSDGLRKEWETELYSPSLRLVKPSPGKDAVVIPGNFRPERRVYAIAALAAGLALMAGALFQVQRIEKDSSPLASAETASLEAESPGTLHVPQLLLEEEVQDLSSLDFVETSDSPINRLDASYLEAKTIVPAGFNPQGGAVRSFFLDRAGLDRVDSYLPPVGNLSFHRFPKTGMIETRTERGSDEGNGSRVLVSGFVTMGGGESAARLAGGFQPVAFSGNPVVNEDSDLRLLADLNGLQRELSNVIAELPRDAAKRADLERALERSRRIADQLEEGLTR